MKQLTLHWRPSWHSVWVVVWTASWGGLPPSAAGFPHCLARRPGKPHGAGSPRRGLTGWWSSYHGSPAATETGGGGSYWRTMGLWKQPRLKLPEFKFKFKTFPLLITIYGYKTYYAKLYHSCLCFKTQPKCYAMGHVVQQPSLGPPHWHAIIMSSPCHPIEDQTPQG